ncbi:MAG: DUF4147 domain-containing protein [Deltaproteobacteria bacterium]|nr:DUF4147 domain-containing protein [Deltaproteobacteria bacterium]
MTLDPEGLFRETVARLSGERLVEEALSRSGLVGPTRVIALGKAALGMTRGAARVLGEVSGVAATFISGAVPEGVRLLQGSHPIPDVASERAGRELLAEAAGAPAEEPLAFLISGGGSAIAASPARGITLADKVETTRALLHGGVPIEEINAVRKHLSALKGGHLGARARSARRYSFVLCDVPSGDLASVASGPTSGDPTTFAQCLGIVRDAALPLPERVQARLQAGARGEIDETPKPDDPRLEGIAHVLLAAPADLSRVASELAGERGERCAAHPLALRGSLDEWVERCVRFVRSGGRSNEATSWLALSGEPSLRIPAGAGRGGRMQHLALLLARELSGAPFVAMCAGSDGRDGDTPHAGAQADGETARRARGMNVDLDRAIARFDSATTCAALGVAVPAFDSGTNLCDLVLIRRG